MTPKQLKEILDFIEAGKKRDVIAKHYGWSLRTLGRKLQPYKKEVEQSVKIYKQVVSNIFS